MEAPIFMLSLSLSSPNSPLSKQEEAIALKSHLYASFRGETMSVRLVFDALQATSLAYLILSLKGGIGSSMADPNRDLQVSHSHELDSHACA